MSRRTQSRKARAWLLGVLGIILVAVAIPSVYLAFGPDALDFAGGTRVALSDYRGADPSGVPPELRAASLTERGRYLAQAADCVVCHTAPGGSAFAGGRAFVLPFGALYSTNLTPDVSTGIGGYSDVDFMNALRRGIGRDGRRLYPAMPYPSYTYLSDADALAIKAYLMTLPAIDSATPANTLAFPFNQRSLMRIWSAFFNPNRRYEPNFGRNPEWNRGAYLVEALGHCGDCHTPRNLFFALDNRRKFAGAIADGWQAYNITPDESSGLGAWADADLATYLAGGHASGRGTAVGPMGEVADESLKHLTASDLRAMVVYLRSVNRQRDDKLPAPKMTPAPASHSEGVAAEIEPQGKRIYAGVCAGCHGWTGMSPAAPSASLIGARAVNDPTGINVAQVILHGGQRTSPDPTENMPAFGDAYSDEEIASVTNYVTARLGARAATLTAQRVAELRAQE
jgi:mono/diheme cytochrome c family protein